MIIFCANCQNKKPHYAKGLCKKCYNVSDDYKALRNVRRLGNRKKKDQRGRIKPRKRVNEILRKIKRTGGLTDSEEVIKRDIMTLKKEISMVNVLGQNIN